LEVDPGGRGDKETRGVFHSAGRRISTGLSAARAFSETDRPPGVMTVSPASRAPGGGTTDCDQGNSPDRLAVLVRDPAAQRPRLTEHDVAEIAGLAGLERRRSQRVDENAPARRAYEALGYRLTGDFAIVILAAP
jgi:hypothetical protein